MLEYYAHVLQTRQYNILNNDIIISVKKVPTKKIMIAIGILPVTNVTASDIMLAINVPSAPVTRHFPFSQTHGFAHVLANRIIGTIIAITKAATPKVIQSAVSILGIKVT